MVEQRFRYYVARKLQRGYRAHLASVLERRQRLERERYVAAANVQAHVRRLQASRAFAAARSSSIRVQKAVRALLERLSAAAALRELRRLELASATTIQRAVRKWRWRRFLASMRLQRSYRAHLCRKLLKTLRAVRLAHDQEQQAKEWARRAAEEVARMNAQIETAAREAAQASQEAVRLRGLTAPTESRPVLASSRDESGSTR